MPSRDTRMKDKTTILFVVNDPRFFVTHRLILAKGIRDAGYAVHVAVPLGMYAAAEEAIAEAGIQVHHVGIERQGRNAIRDLAAILRLVRLYRELRPDIVHHITVKPILYGSIAARIARIPGVVNAISGRGRLFANHTFASRLRAVVLTTLYRAVLRHPNAILIFQNADDRSSFIRAAIVDEEYAVLIEGSGTELQRFDPNARPDEPPIVLLPARILRQKGVGEFIGAARVLRQEGSVARFVIVGDSAGNRDAFPSDELELARKNGFIETWGWSEDMPGVMAKAAIVCLPTYHEGLPKALIDACAAGRPIVATDIAGCRAVVTHGVNGFLVPPRHVTALANALRALLSDPVLRGHMGRQSLEVAAAKFDVALVIRATLEVYKALETASGTTACWLFPR
jgi:glycosyltransferase involved in cell wall biosynthesis